MAERDIGKEIEKCLTAEHDDLRRHHEMLAYLTDRLTNADAELEKARRVVNAAQQIRIGGRYIAPHVVKELEEALNAYRP